MHGQQNFKKVCRSGCHFRHAIRL